MTVTPIAGEPLRFIVESSEPGKPYIVDLEENAPLGSCFCRHWVCRVFPEYKRTGALRRCKHIVACRDQLLDRLIENHVQNQTNQ
jgi:hypothetical protein